MTDCRNPAISKPIGERSGMGERGTRSHLSGAFSDYAKKDRASDRDVAWLPGMCTVAPSTSGCVFVGVSG